MLLGAQKYQAMQVVSGNERTEVSTSRSGGVIKFGIVLVLLCASVFQELGINTPVYFAEFSLLAQYLLLIFMLGSGNFRFDRTSTLLFGACFILSSISFVLNAESASSTSLLLILVLYLP